MCARARLSRRSARSTCSRPGLPDAPTPRSSPRKRGPTSVQEYGSCEMGMTGKPPGWKMLGPRFRGDERRGGAYSRIRPLPAFVALALVAALVLTARGAHAQSMNLHGRLAVQDAGDFSRDDSLQSALGARDANDLLANLRLI